MISIIIPTLNEERYLKSTMESIKGQQYNGHYEIIVADGQSRDRTLKIAKNYTKKLIIVKKKGISAGRNAGAKKSKGDILLFLDADTKIDPNALKEFEKVFKDDKIVGVSVLLRPSRHSILNEVSYMIFNIISKSSVKLGKPLLAGVCVAYRKTAFERVCGFDEKLKSGEDLDMSLRTSKLGKCLILDDIYVSTSTRRLDNWGPVKFLYRYFKTYFTGKMCGNGEYEPVR